MKQASRERRVTTIKFSLSKAKTTHKLSLLSLKKTCCSLSLSLKCSSSTSWMSPESSTNSPESSKVRRKIHNSGDTSGFRRAPIRIFFTLLKPDRYPLFEYEPGNIQNTINPPTSNSYSRANGGKKNEIKKLGSRTIPWCLTKLWMAPDSSYVFGFGAVFLLPLLRLYSFPSSDSGSSLLNSVTMELIEDCCSWMWFLWNWRFVLMNILDESLNLVMDLWRFEVNCGGWSLLEMKIVVVMEVLWWILMVDVVDDDGGGRRLWWLERGWRWSCGGRS